MSDRYPHKCPACAGEAYINGMDQVECSVPTCKNWDGKSTSWEMTGTVEEIHEAINKAVVAINSVGNPHYQTPNPGPDTATQDDDWIAGDCRCHPPYCDKCRKKLGLGDSNP